MSDFTTRLFGTPKREEPKKPLSQQQEEKKADIQKDIRQFENKVTEWRKESTRFHNQAMEYKRQYELNGNQTHKSNCITSLKRKQHLESLIKDAELSIDQLTGNLRQLEKSSMINKVNKAMMESHKLIKGSGEQDKLFDIDKIQDTLDENEEIDADLEEITETYANANENKHTEINDEFDKLETGFYDPIEFKEQLPKTPNTIIYTDEPIQKQQKTRTLVTDSSPSSIYTYSSSSSSPKKTTDTTTTQQSNQKRRNASTLFDDFFM